MVARWRGPWSALAAILAVAAMVRCQHLADLSYDFDEAASWKLTTFPLTEIGSRLAHDLPPPLYFYCLWAWSRLFGDSPEALRSLSVVFGLVTVGGAYLFVAEIGRSRIRENSGTVALGTTAAENGPLPNPILRGEGELAPDAGPLTEGEGQSPELSRVLLRSPGELPALAAAALLALSPLQVAFSQRSRMYALGAALSLVSCWLLLRALRRAPPRWRDYVLYALASAALAYTHSFGLLIIAAQFLYALGCVIHGSLGTLRGADGPHPGPRRPLAGPEGEGEKACAGEGERRLSVPHPSSLMPDRSSFISHRSAVAMAFAIVALLYLPWAANSLGQFQRASQSYPSHAFAWDDVAKACYQTLAVRWQDAPPSATVAWCATAACLLPALAMLAWGRGGLRLIGLCVLVTFDAIISFSVGAQNVVISRYLVFANALILCGLPPLLVCCPVGTDPKRQPGAASDVPRLGFGLAMGRATLAGLVAGMAWLCLAHAERRESYARQPGIMAAMAYLAEVAQEREPIVVSNPMVQVAAAGHACGQDAPRVLSPSSSFPYFQGTALMRPDEYLSPPALDALGGRRVWAIDALNCFSGTWTVRLSDDWIDVSEEFFPVPPSPKSQIVVRCYERRQRK